MLKSIFQAAHENDITMLSTILDRHPSLVTCIDERTGWTPLHFAAHQNATETARLLLERQADPNALDSGGVTPLQLSGGEGVLRLLRSKGACFSETYQTLKKAQQSNRMVRFSYHEHVREVRIIQLGLTAGEERCFAWQRDAQGDEVEAGLRCFRVHEMSQLEVSEAEAVELSADSSRLRACVGLVDADF
jgi:hypothetical protein